LSSPSARTRRSAAGPLTTEDESAGKGRFAVSTVWPRHQGCHIFLGTTYKNCKNMPKCLQNIPDGHKIYQMAVKETKCSKNLPTSLIARPSKIYPIWHFWFENIPSVNTVRQRNGSSAPFRHPVDAYDEKRDAF
jgi:hypothetical protein